MFAALLVVCSIVPVEHVPEVHVDLVEFNHYERTDVVGFLNCGDLVILRQFDQASEIFHIADTIHPSYVTGPFRSKGRWVTLVETYEGRMVRVVAKDVFSSRTDFNPDWVESRLLPSEDRRSVWPFFDEELED